MSLSRANGAARLAYRASAGRWVPAAYFPLSKPPASGAHGMVAIPYDAHIGNSSRSIRRSSRL